ncbi:MAG: hypothetical protein ACPLZH_00465, partial [Minisyncoccales bacterium]
SLYAFVRIFMLWILAVIAPIAFSTIIFEKSRVYNVVFPGFFKWDKWLESVLVWSFLVIPIVVIFYMGDSIQAAVEKSGLTNEMQTALSHFFTSTPIGDIEGSKYFTDALNSIMRLLAHLAPTIVLFVFYAMAFSEIKNRIKEMTSAIVANLTGGANLMGTIGGTIAGFGAGALAAGTGLLAGGLGAVGLTKTASVVKTAGLLPAKALSLTGAKGQAWTARAKSWSEGAPGAVKSGWQKAKSVAQKTVKAAPTIAGAAPGALAGGSIGMLFGPLGALAGMAIGGIGGGIAGKKLLKKAPIDVNEMERYQERKANQEFLGRGNDLFATIAASNVDFTSKAKAISLLGEKKSELSPEQQGTLDTQIKQFTGTAKAILRDDTRSFAEKHAAYKFLEDPNIGAPITNKEREEMQTLMRESASQTLKDKNASPMEKGAAIKTLAELENQPLEKEDIENLQKFLPQTEGLSRDQKISLLARAPSLAPSLGIDQRFAISASEKRGQLPRLPVSEIDKIFDNLTDNQKKMILEQGGLVQKAKTIELILRRDYQIKIRPDIDVKALETDPNQAPVILGQLKEFMVEEKTYQEITRAIEERVKRRVQEAKEQGFTLTPGEQQNIKKSQAEIFNTLFKI